MTAGNHSNNSESDFSPSNPWPELVMAMLSVNNFPLSKTVTLWEGLRKSGLFNPSNYQAWQHDEIARRLVSAGYDRGAVMTEIFVKRLASLKDLTNDLVASERVLCEGTKSEVQTLLACVTGIGPKVIENFLLLRGRGTNAG